MNKKQYLKYLQELKKAKNMKAIIKARDNFFNYCKLMADDFYKESRRYLIQLTDTLQTFADSESDVLVVNVPPRFGKSRTAGLYVEWMLGRDPSLKIMTGSYNETLSTMFSKNVRNTIQEEKAQENTVVYSDVFPETKIKRGDGASNLWGLVGGHNNYLATSPTGTATGFGADILIIDDLIKNDTEAYTERVLENHWEWFTNTMLSRLETGGKIIIIMTRWNSKDLAGRALDELPDLGYNVEHVNMKAKQDDGSMLCEEILSEEEYNRKTKTMGLHIAEANYNQNPIDIKGKLYTSFKTYSQLPRERQVKRILNYTDTADTGKDYLCSITAAESNGELYVLDVLYTKAGMEETEPQTAKHLYDNGVNLTVIESNNGGRGFSRNVQRIMWEKYKTRRTSFKWFHQSKNKEARIISGSTFVMDHVYFPENWKDRWPEYYKAMNSYQREGKNINDDAPDATTGLTEQVAHKGNVISGQSAW